MLHYLASTLGPAQFQEIVQSQAIPGAHATDPENASAGHAVFYALLAYRDAHGQTVADHWEYANWEGLNNDERVAMQSLRKSFVTVIEVQRILDHQSLECVDVLQPNRKPFLLLDRCLADQVVRFTRLFGWWTHYPHFCRPAGGMGVVIPPLAYEDFVREMLLHMDKETHKKPNLTQNQYLAENYGRCYQLMCQLGERAIKKIGSKMDLHECTAVYSIVGPRQAVENVLRSKEDFEEERTGKAVTPKELRFVWLSRGASKKVEEQMSIESQHQDERHGVGVLGTVRIDADRVVIQTLSRKKFVFAKKMARKYFGKRLALQSEAVVDIARQTADRVADRVALGSAPAVSPPQPVSKGAEKQFIEKFYLQQYQKFLDEPVPALDDLTPRQAAQTPTLRPRLIMLMKQHLHGLESTNHEKGVNIKIDWVLDELGLTELK